MIRGRKTNAKMDEQQQFEAMASLMGWHPCPSQAGQTAVRWMREGGSVLDWRFQDDLPQWHKEAGAFFDARAELLHHGEGRLSTDSYVRELEGVMERRGLPGVSALAELPQMVEALLRCAGRWTEDGTPDLLPCPFCGGVAEEGPGNSWEGQRQVMCQTPDCRVTAEDLFKGPTASEIWNRRAP